MSLTEIPQTAAFPVPEGMFAETVTEVQHYTDRLFRFRITRPASFRFRSGEFVMIGLPNAAKPVMRAYSIASPAWDEEIEFYSIKVPGGPLTEHLQKIKVGDTVLMKKKPTGTLVLDALLPGKRVYMFATGTGIAPFASLIRDPETYEKSEQVILCHTCRDAAELTYGQDLVRDLRVDFGERALVSRGRSDGQSESTAGFGCAFNAHGGVSNLSMAGAQQSRSRNRLARCRWLLVGDPRRCGAQGIRCCRRRRDAGPNRWRAGGGDRRDTY